jgi:hypothetical protein
MTGGDQPIAVIPTNVKRIKYLVGIMEDNLAMESNPQAIHFYENWVKNALFVIDCLANGAKEVRFRYILCDQLYDQCKTLQENATAATADSLPCDSNEYKETP